jgi:MFS family permease
MKKNGIFYGWWVLVSLFFISIVGPMGRYSLSAIAPFIKVDLSWSSEQIGLAFSIHFAVYAFAAILSGWLIDKIGSRRTFIIGGVITFTGMALLSRMTSLWQFYLFFGFIMGLALSVTHAVPAITTARKWFYRRGGLAVGIVSAAFVLGTALLSPLITIMCNSFLGWRNTWFICAVAFSSIIIFLSLLLVRDSPKSKGLYPDGMSQEESIKYEIAVAGSGLTIKGALKTLSLWMFLVSYSLFLFPAQGLVGHLVLWAVGLGYPEAIAGIYVSTMTLPMAVMGLFGGWLGDRIGKKPVMILACAMGILATIYGWLFVNTESSLFIFVIFFGTSQGLALPLFAAYLGDIFGLSSLGKLFGILTLGGGLIGGSGPFIWGKLFEVAHDYNLACLISAVCLTIATAALVMIKPILLFDAERQINNH